MILEKIIQTENVAKHAIKISVRKLAAIRSIRKLLNQIDFSSEIVPIEDKESLERLFVSLKGKILDKDEKELIEELTNK